MSTSSDIEWTDATWNPVSGCTRASVGCDNCYAVKQTYRLERMGQVKKYGGLTVLNKAGDRHFNGVVRTDEAALSTPLGWKKPKRVFVNSMSDLFHKDVPFDFIDKVFAVMALTPQHTYQVLTKRPERMAEYTYQYATPTRWNGAAFRMALTAASANDLGWNNPLPNVWLGTSVENQKAADERIPHLLRCPAAVRFLSCEPLIGAVDLLHLPRVGLHHDYLTGEYQSASEKASTARVGWVIVGGESGGGARPFNVQWARDIIGQCKAAGVPVFVKQLGAWPVTTVAEVMSLLGGKDDDTDNLDDLELRDKKGGNPDEWPGDLNVREFPRTAAEPASV